MNAVEGGFSELNVAFPPYDTATAAAAPRSHTAAPPGTSSGLLFAAKKIQPSGPRKLRLTDQECDRHRQALAELADDFLFQLPQLVKHASFREAFFGETPPADDDLVYLPEIFQAIFASSAAVLEQSCPTALSFDQAYSGQSSQQT
jgi:hypothetical protein